MGRHFFFVEKTAPRRLRYGEKLGKKKTKLGNGPPNASGDEYRSPFLGGVTVQDPKNWAQLGNFWVVWEAGGDWGGGGPWTTTGSTVFPFSFWRTTGRTSGSRVSFVLSTPKKKNRLIGCRRRTAKPPPKKTAGTARPGTHTAKKGHVRSSHNCVIFPWSTKKKEEEEKFEIKSKDNDPYPPLPNRFRGKFDEKSINSVW